MVATATNDTLGTMGGQLVTSWDWKGSYIDKLSTEGYERFSQFSASPDTTALFAGPARYTGVAGAATLVPIGLADGIQLSSQASIQPLFEIGSNRTFFTRGKTSHSLSLGRLLADQRNILAALSQQSYNSTATTNTATNAAASANQANMQMNLGSESFSVPFGLLLFFKTRGNDSTGDVNGRGLAAIYCESCLFQGYSFSVASQSPVIQESVQIVMDRIVPVSF
jgi:hypothetical protein